MEEHSAADDDTEASTLDKSTLGIDEDSDHDVDEADRYVENIR